MNDADSYMWAWFASWIANCAHITDYRQTYAERSAPLRHRQRALVYMTRHLIELDRLCTIRPKLSI